MRYNIYIYQKKEKIKSKMKRGKPKMKKVILTVILAAFLLMSFTVSASASFIRAFTIDDFTITGQVNIIEDAYTHDRRALQGMIRDNAGNQHFTTLEVTVPAAGRYYIWALVFATHADDNSLFFSLNGAPQFTWDYMEIANNDPGFATFPYYNRWYWMYLSNREHAVRTHGISPDGHVHTALGKDLKRYVVELNAGVNTIRLATREPGAKYNALLITDDPNYDPNTDPLLPLGTDPRSVYGPPPAAPAPPPAPAAPAASAEPPATSPVAPMTGDTAFMALILMFALSAAAVYKLRKNRAG